MVKKKWRDLAPGECTFWKYREGGRHFTVFVIACPKCGECLEISSDYLIVNRDGVQIHMVRPVSCMGDDCGAKFYCNVGGFKYVRT